MTPTQYAGLDKNQFIIYAYMVHWFGYSTKEIKLGDIDKAIEAPRDITYYTNERRSTILRVIGYEKTKQVNINR